jgi:hypothetical protein
LAISPAALGLIYGVGSLGGLLGASPAVKVVRRFGMRPAGVGAQAVWVLGVVIYDIDAVSLRQAITPGRLLGRVSATARFITWGTMPVGFPPGDAGEVIAVRPTLAVAGLGVLLASLWALLSPTRVISAPPRLEQEPWPAA